MKRFLSLALIISFSSLFSSDDMRLALSIPLENVVSRNIHEPFAIGHDNDGFFVAQENKISRVNAYDVAPELRKMDMNKAAKVLSVSSIKVSRLSNGEYTIARHGEIKGGGPIGAAIGFFGGLAVPYIVQAAVVAGATAVGTITGGLAGAVVAAGSAQAWTAGPTALAAKESALYGSITLGTMIPF